ncbi:MAG: hypothetical protein GXY61_07865 [Lentisphaerae bacterium]|nr:hypothetical protein [Lentisphaerota bacterium]
MSKKQLNSHQGSTCFDPKELGEKLERACPEAIFCLLMGSAVGGIVKEGSDLDLAFYLEGAPTLNFYSRVSKVVDELAPGVRCDTGILNRTEPVFRFEALKGQLLFVRNEEQYARFFSLSCREYESQMFDYERQRKYRLEARRAI